MVNQVLDQDIVFECPHCGKSMAIDPRGAGYVITCPECTNQMTVPQPVKASSGGMSATGTAVSAAAGVAGVAATRTPVQAPVGDLSQALMESSAKVKELTERLREVSARRKYLEHVHDRSSERIEKVRQEFSVIQGALDRLYDVMQELDAAED